MTRCGNELHWLRGLVSGLPRILVASAVAVLLLVSPRSAVAQDATSIPVEQAVRVRYGDDLTFSVRASASSTIAQARLNIEVLNRSTQVVESVTIEPSLTIQASHTVSVQNLQLPPVASISYHWDFVDVGGRELQGEIGHLQYEDNRVPWAWATTTQGEVTAHTDARDRQLPDAVLSISNEAIADAERTIGYGLDGPVHVYVYPELAALANSLRTHNSQVQDWVAAYAIPDQHAILVAAQGPELLVTLQRDIPHEMMHLVIFEAAGAEADRVPAWFNEGLALNAAPEPDPTLLDTLYAAATARSLQPVESLCTADFGSLPPHDAALAYAQSQSLVSYISTKLGSSYIPALMAYYAEGLSCSAAVERALGITLTDLEAQWQAEIAATAVSQTPASKPSLVPWLIAWAISLLVALLFLFPQPSRHEERPLFDTYQSLKPVPPDDSVTR